MNPEQTRPARVLILFYTLSSQTKKLVIAIQEGLEENGVTVNRQRLKPLKPPRFPFNGFLATFYMMFATFLRKRFSIQPVDSSCFEEYDLIFLAGPTWSYNPSGLVLSLLDTYGKGLFKEKKVITVISCRGYYRWHRFVLSFQLKKCGAHIIDNLIVGHPNSEPWKTIGVFLKLAGKKPERSPFIGKYYRRYGHSHEQIEKARSYGVTIGKALVKGLKIEDMNFTEVMNDEIST